MQNALPSLDQPLDLRDTPQYRLLKAMHEILDEVFNHASLNETVYMVYKTESCFQLESAGKAPRPFDNVHPELLACAALASNEKIIECSMVAAGAER